MVIPTPVFSVIDILLWLVHQCCLSVWSAFVLRPLIFTYRPVKNYENIYENMERKRKCPAFNQKTGTIQMITIWIKCFIRGKNNKYIIAFNTKGNRRRLNTWHTLPSWHNSFEWHTQELSLTPVNRAHQPPKEPFPIGCRALAVHPALKPVGNDLSERSFTERFDCGFIFWSVSYSGGQSTVVLSWR